MNFGKKILIATLALTLLFGLMAAMASPLPDVTVTIDGELVVFEDQGPIIVDNRTLVPVRGVFEALDFYPTWDEDARQATLTRDDYVVVLTIGSYTFTTNGEEFDLDVAPRVVNNRTLLPLRFVLESVGYNNMDFDPVTRVVSIYTTPLADQPTPTPTPSPTPSPVPLTIEDLGLTIIRLEYEDDPLLAEAAFLHMYLYHDEGGDTLMIRTARNLYEFSMLLMTPNGTGDIVTYEPYEIIRVVDNTFLPNEAFIINGYMSVGTVPWSGITFLDENGDRWYFAILQDQSDEFPPYRLLPLMRNPSNEDVLIMQPVN